MDIKIVSKANLKFVWMGLYQNPIFPTKPPNTQRLILLIYNTLCSLWLCGRHQILTFDSAPNEIISLKRKNKSSIHCRQLQLSEKKRNLKALAKKIEKLIQKS